MIFLIFSFLLSSNFITEASNEYKQTKGISVNIKIIEDGIDDDKVFLHPNNYSWEKLPYSHYSLPPFSKPTWYRISLDAYQKDSKIIRFNYELIPVLEVYVISSLNDSIQHFSLGTLSIPIKGAKNLVLDFQKGETKEIYYKVYGLGGSVSSDPEIYDLNTTEVYQKSTLLIICRTIIAFFIITCIVFFYLSKKLEYIQFLLFLIGIILFSESEMGTLLGLFSIKDVDSSYLIRLIGNHLFVLSLLFFLKSFLKVQFHFKRKRFIIGLNIFLFIQYLLLVFLSDNSLIWGISYISIIGISYYIIFLIFNDILIPSFKAKKLFSKHTIIVCTFISLISMVFITAPHLGIYPRNYYSNIFIYFNGILSSIFIIYLLTLDLLFVNNENVRLLSLEKEFQKAYLKAVLQSQKEERLKINTEIKTHILKNLLSIQKDSYSLKKEIQSTIKQIIIKVNSISNSLIISEEKHENWVHDITILTDTFSTKKCLFTLNTNVETISLSSENLHHLFNIINELYTNAIKHSNASLVTLDITKNEKSLMIIYNDNGTGFKTDKIKYGIGLQSINKHIEFMNGTIMINSNNHLNINISIPFTKKKSFQTV